ncbi:MAG: bifunctional 4-hydroxy-2-oxoglutarate aldolase/2-dehydro-3-deoxy-phosphogluconate aldolase [Longicatena sp.]
MTTLMDRLSGIGIVPVVKITKGEHAIPLARALYNGGIDCAEITFRSEYALQAISDIKNDNPDMLLGAGTILNVEQAAQALEAGAQFIVTPGFNEKVVSWCIEKNVPILPGVSTATEIELALSHDLHEMKFFPAQSSGGAQKIKDLSAPYADIRIMPTGGINKSNMHEYLSLPNVIAIGGSFMLPQDVIDNEDWDGIEALSKDAIKAMLGYELIHLGINSKDCEEATKTAQTLCNLFQFAYYKKPKSHFAGRGFEVLNGVGRGKNGHIGIYTPYPQRALYHLAKQGIQSVEESITRNKKTKLINFVYLDTEVSGFGIHLINPDVKM